MKRHILLDDMPPRCALKIGNSLSGINPHHPKTPNKTIDPDKLLDERLSRGNHSTEGPSAIDPGVT